MCTPRDALLPCLILAALSSAAFAESQPLQPEDVPKSAAKELSAARARKILDAALANGALSRQALVALGASHRDDATQKLTVALEAKDPRTRAAAAQGLGLLGQPAACGNVLQRWAEEKSWEVKIELATAASDCGDPHVATELKTALESKSRSVRAAAASALAQMGEADGEQALAKLGIPKRDNPSADWKSAWRSYQVLSGKKRGDRKAAFRNLAQFGGTEDAVLFERALDDPDPVIRLWAAAGLCRLNG